MTTRSERDRQKALQDKHQMILAQLLKDEDNKYCVDCDAKGPRWAAWNLGIFLCIRCAGIHRNLGVHISKVKSVNLDTWTPEQVAMMQEMGNSRARAVYEANVPDSFRRPQSDSGLEAFIRAKYEHKKYIAHEWVPPKPKIPQYDEDGNEIREKKLRPTRDPVFEEMPRKEKKKIRQKADDVKLSTPPASRPQAVVAAPAETAAVSRPEPKKQTVDLLGLEEPVPAAPAPVADDPFGAFVGNTGAPSTGPAAQDNALINHAPVSNENLLGLGEPSSLQNGDISNGGLEANASSGGDGKKSKESILALFGNTSQQQAMYGVPGGMYMQQGGAQMGMYGSQMPNGMMQMGGMGTGMGTAMSTGMNPGIAMQQPSNLPAFNGCHETQGYCPDYYYAQMWGTAMQNGMMGGQMTMAGGGGLTQMNMGGMPVSSSMNSMTMPLSSSLSNMQHPQMAGGMYAMPNTMYSGQLQQAQQQMAALSMGGQQMNASSQYGQLGTVAAGGGGMGMAGLGGWGGVPQTGNTMSTNLWQ